MPRKTKNRKSRLQGKRKGVSRLKQTIAQDRKQIEERNCQKSEKVL